MRQDGWLSLQERMEAVRAPVERWLWFCLPRRQKQLSLPVLAFMNGGESLKACERSNASPSAGFLPVSDYVL